MAIAEHVARDHCLAPERVDAPVGGGRYSRLFPDLPGLDIDEERLHALGRPGGPCDVGDDPADDPDSAVAAVWPFFGQFVAHDITADRSPLTHRSDPESIRNFRAPRVNLESMYGSGPVGSPYLYEKDDPARLLLGPGGHDVPRNHEGLALLGDPRNDVHLFMNQMQVAFIGLHNRLVDALRANGIPEADVFDEARQSATWHYQWIVLRDFLPSLIGADLTAGLLAGGSRVYGSTEVPYIPFEFADAAYRYGHSQVRQRYQVNENLGPCPVFPDLIGFGAVDSGRAVDWRMHVDVPGGAPAQRAKKIDGRLPASLIALPTQISGEKQGSDYASLANRDLQRGQAIGLPSGEAVARELGVEPITPAQIGLSAGGWTDETPLWYYVLKEAEVTRNGDGLGAVGGRIVGEVLVGIIDADPESFRSADPEWAPSAPGHEAGRFGLADVLVASVGG